MKSSTIKLWERKIFTLSEHRKSLQTKKNDFENYSLFTWHTELSLALTDAAPWEPCLWSLSSPHKAGVSLGSVHTPINLLQVLVSSSHPGLITRQYGAKALGSRAVLRGQAGNQGPVGHQYLSTCPLMLLSFFFNCLDQLATPSAAVCGQVFFVVQLPWHCRTL